MDNPFDTPTEGQADWDSGLAANFQALERGYHITERAGTAISTGQILWLSSGGFFMPFDPNSATIFPTGMAFTAAASGDSFTALAWGIVRSLAINSAIIPGNALFVSVLTPGQIVTTNSGTNRKIGRGVVGQGILFQPSQCRDINRMGDLLDVNTTGLADGMIPKWSNASSKFVMSVDSGGGGGGGATTFGALTDVNTTGITDGSIPKWSNASSKFIMGVDSTGGGGGVSVGSPPSIVQVGFITGGNVVTFTTTPASGDLLVAMTWNDFSDTVGTGWVKLDENSSGTDYGLLLCNTLTAPGVLANTVMANSNADDAIIVWELKGNKAATPSFLADAITAELTGAAGASGNLPNLTDMIGLSGMGIVSTAASLSAMYNVNSSAFVNSGTHRHIAAGWSNASIPLVQILAKFTASTNFKGIVALFTS